MHPGLTKLNILLDLIGRKRVLLSQILTICENQELILSAPRSDDNDRLFIGMGNEKQLLVDQVVAADELFQKMFDEMGEAFHEIGEANKDVVRKMQEGIMGVTELDAKIRLAENRNLECISRARTTVPPKPVNEVSKQQVLQEYKAQATKGKRKK
ncbi:MAG: hypothetical protein FWD98_09655 [Defluviitaleaceae bacterium]|nr:hypothetical protein [Defluviitaleaceae bacterium]